MEVVIYIAELYCLTAVESYFKKLCSLYACKCFSLEWVIFWLCFPTSLNFVPFSPFYVSVESAVYNAVRVSEFSSGRLIKAFLKSYHLKLLHCFQ